jgi:hypothetical protein
MNHPSRLVMLCDRARVLARSDQPETMPIYITPTFSDKLPSELGRRRP